MALQDFEAQELAQFAEDISQAYEDLKARNLALACPDPVISGLRMARIAVTMVVWLALRISARFMRSCWAFPLIRCMRGMRQA